MRPIQRAGLRRYPSTGAPGELVVDAADFDGTNDYALRGGGLTNAVDSKLLTLVAWIKSDVLNTSRYMHATSSGVTRLELFEPGGADSTKLRLAARNNSGTTILQLLSNTALSTTAWQCWMFSVDLADTAKRHLYLGDTDDMTVETYTNDTMDLAMATPQWSIGANATGGSKVNGGMAEVMLWIGQYIDLSVEANRRLFFSAGGKPVDPNAASGAFSVLGTPDIYFHLDNGETANNFVDNSGGDGGAYTVTGALSTYASSPSD